MRIVYTRSYAEAEQMTETGVTRIEGGPKFHYVPGDWLVTSENGVVEWYTDADFRRIFGPRNNNFEKMAEPDVIGEGENPQPEPLYDPENRV